MSTLRSQLILPDGKLGYELSNFRQGRKVILLLNGSLFNYRQWGLLLRVGFRRFGLKPLLPEYSFLRFDYRGTGTSGCEPTKWDVEQLAKEVLSLLDHLNLEKVDIYGISKGTIVGQYLAKLAPERINTLAGYGWFHYDYSEMEKVVKYFSIRLQQFSALKQQAVTPLTYKEFLLHWQNVCDYVLSYKIRKFHPSLLTSMSFIAGVPVKRLAYHLLEPSPSKTLYEWFEYAVEMMPQAKSYFPEIQQALNDKAVLIQHAQYDGTLPFKMAQELHLSLPNSTLISYPKNFNHISIMLTPTQAVRVTADYASWLNKQD